MLVSICIGLYVRGVARSTALVLADIAKASPGTKPEYRSRLLNSLASIDISSPRVAAEKLKQLASFLSPCSCLCHAIPVVFIPFCAILLSLIPPHAPSAAFTPVLIIFSVFRAEHALPCHLFRPHSLRSAEQRWIPAHHAQWAYDRLMSDLKSSARLVSE
ncbi:hypothetical protein DFH07DRAFT_234064 [Mycena maculata]|nr:hypothetical protein DFH07DRAFT_234064 [Mycena maculata]